MALELSLTVGTLAQQKPFKSTVAGVRFTDGGPPYLLRDETQIMTCNAVGKVTQLPAPLGKDAKKLCCFAVAAGGRFAAGVTSDARLLIWNLRAGTLHTVLPDMLDDDVPSPMPSPLVGERKRGLFSKRASAATPASFVTLSPDGTLVVVQAPDGAYWLLSRATGTHIWCRLVSHSGTTVPAMLPGDSLFCHNSEMGHSFSLFFASVRYAQSTADALEASLWAWPVSKLASESSSLVGKSVPFRKPLVNRAGEQVGIVSKCSDTGRFVAMAVNYAVTEKAQLLIADVRSKACLSLCIGPLIQREIGECGPSITMEAIAWLCEDLFVSVLLSYGHWAVFSNTGCPIRLLPSAALSRMYKWYPAEPGARRAGGVSTSTFFAPLCWDPQFKKDATGAYSADIHPSGRMLLLCNGRNFSEILLPAALCVPFWSTPRLRGNFWLNVDSLSPVPRSALQLRHSTTGVHQSHVPEFWTNLYDGCAVPQTSLEETPITDLRFPAPATLGVLADVVSVLLAAPDMASVEGLKLINLPSAALAPEDAYFQPLELPQPVLTALAAVASQCVPWCVPDALNRPWVVASCTAALVRHIASHHAQAGALALAIATSLRSMRMSDGRDAWSKLVPRIGAGLASYLASRQLYAEAVHVIRACCGAAPDRPQSVRKIAMLRDWLGVAGAALATDAGVGYRWTFATCAALAITAHVKRNAADAMTALVSQKQIQQLVKISNTDTPRAASRAMALWCGHTAAARGDLVEAAQHYRDAGGAALCNLVSALLAVYDFGGALAVVMRTIRAVTAVGATASASGPTYLDADHPWTADVLTAWRTQALEAKSTAANGPSYDEAIAAASLLGTIMFEYFMQDHVIRLPDPCHAAEAVKRVAADLKSCTTKGCSVFGSVDELLTLDGAAVSRATALCPDWSPVQAIRLLAVAELPERAAQLYARMLPELGPNGLIGAAIAWGTSVPGATLIRAVRRVVRDTLTQDASKLLQQQGAPLHVSLLVRHLPSCLPASHVPMLRRQVAEDAARRLAACVARLPALRADAAISRERTAGGSLSSRYRPWVPAVVRETVRAACHSTLQSVTYKPSAATPLASVRPAAQLNIAVQDYPTFGAVLQPLEHVATARWSEVEHHAIGLEMQESDMAQSQVGVGLGLVLDGIVEGGAINDTKDADVSPDLESPQAVIAAAATAIDVLRTCASLADVSLASLFAACSPAASPVGVQNLSDLHALLPAARSILLSLWILHVREMASLWIQLAGSISFGSVVLGGALGMGNLGAGSPQLQAAQLAAEWVARLNLLSSTSHVRANKLVQSSALSMLAELVPAHPLAVWTAAARAFHPSAELAPGMSAKLKKLQDAVRQHPAPWPAPMSWDDNWTTVQLSLKTAVATHTSNCAAWSSPQETESQMITGYQLSSFAFVQSDAAFEHFLTAFCTVLVAAYEPVVVPVVPSSPEPVAPTPTVPQEEPTPSDKPGQLKKSRSGRLRQSAPPAPPRTTQKAANSRSSTGKAVSKGEVNDDSSVGRISGVGAAAVAAIGLATMKSLSRSHTVTGAMRPSKSEEPDVSRPQSTAAVVEASLAPVVIPSPPPAPLESTGADLPSPGIAREFSVTMSTLIEKAKQQQSMEASMKALKARNEAVAAAAIATPSSVSSSSSAASAFLPSPPPALTSGPAAAAGSAIDAVLEARIQALLSSRVTKPLESLPAPAVVYVSAAAANTAVAALSIATPAVATTGPVNVPVATTSSVASVSTGAPQATSRVEIPPLESITKPVRILGSNVAEAQPVPIVVNMGSDLLMSDRRAATSVKAPRPHANSAAHSAKKSTVVAAPKLLSAAPEPAAPTPVRQLGAPASASTSTALPVKVAPSQPPAAPRLMHTDIPSNGLRLMSADTVLSGKPGPAPAPAAAAAAATHTVGRKPQPAGSYAQSKVAISPVRKAPAVAAPAPAAVEALKTPPRPTGVAVNPTPIAVPRQSTEQAGRLLVLLDEPEVPDGPAAPAPAPAPARASISRPPAPAPAPAPAATRPAPAPTATPAQVLSTHVPAPASTTPVVFMDIPTDESDDEYSGAVVSAYGVQMLRVQDVSGPEFAATESGSKPKKRPQPLAIESSNTASPAMSSRSSAVQISPMKSPPQITASVGGAAGDARGSSLSGSLSSLSESGTSMGSSSMQSQHATTVQRAAADPAALRLELLSDRAAGVAAHMESLSKQVDDISQSFARTHQVADELVAEHQRIAKAAALRSRIRQAGKLEVMMDNLHSQMQGEMQTLDGLQYQSSRQHQPQHQQSAGYAGRYNAMRIATPVKVQPAPTPEPAGGALVRQADRPESPLSSNIAATRRLLEDIEEKLNQRTQAKQARPPVHVAAPAPSDPQPSYASTFSKKQAAKATTSTTGARSLRTAEKAYSTPRVTTTSSVRAPARSATTARGTRL